MFKSGTFRPATQHELSATLDVTWRAMSGARQNMRLIEEECDRAKKSIGPLKEELERAQRKGKEAADALHALEEQSRDSEERRHALEAQLGKAGERQTALEADLSDARAISARLAEEKERLERELAEAHEEIETWNTELAAEEQLRAALQRDFDLLQHAMEQLDKRLNNPLTDPLLTPAHKGRRVIWIGCNGGSDDSSFTTFSMERLVASDPEQALEILSGRGADGLITDIAVTGIDWLSDVRRRWPDLIIIATRGSIDEHLAADSALGSVATTVLTQPFEPEDVAVAARCAFLRSVLSSGGKALDAERAPERPRLLIAEDDESLRTLLSTGLNERGYDTACVEDGAAALEAIEANDFDVLVTDILMPRIDGIELTAKAKTLKPRLPIIILSAAGEVDSSLKAMRAGAYCYVPKPADMKELSLFIERAMLADRLERELRDQNALLDKRTNELDKALHELQELQEAVRLIATRRQSQAERAGVSG